ncbi:MAG: DUF4185 domain-containing protein [Actinomycetota bacterium]|nr:DUF4185 domain-containing protein [Actinomycetota bacterium]
MTMHVTDLHLEPNEASDLCGLRSESLRADRGWDRAFVTVLDEAPAEEAIAVLGHADGAEPGERWEALRVPAKPSCRRGKTDDAEACARHDGWIYLLGSQFGKKGGPLQASRSWLARVREDEIDDALEGGEASLEVAWLRFGLHRAVNDALAGSQVELIERGPQTSQAYIDATIAEGARKKKRWAGRVQASDHPINVEGADFRADGNLLLGLRYPVTAAGEPLLVELEGIEALFDDPEAVPQAAAVWVLEGAGSSDEPAGVRALESEGGDRFDALLGDLDSAGKGACILADHPEGGRALSRHVRFELPLVARGGPVAAQTVHEFEELRRVEGVAPGPDGHFHYVVDMDGQVSLRTLLSDELAGAAPR